MLFLSSGLVRTGFIAAATVGTLVAEDLLGSVTLSGLPAAATTIGVAVGTAPLSAVMARKGRRIGISGGLAVATLGGVLAIIAIALSSFPLFVLGTFTIGFGSAGDRLSRYAAADISTNEQRAFAISIVVWAGTVGSVLGPALIDYAERIGLRLNLESLSGPYLLTITALTAAFLVMWTALRPDPLTFVSEPHQARRGDTRAALALLGQPQIRFAIIALAIGQLVMVIIMAMTPIHIRRAGDSLGTIGLIIAAHTFGMFALSPLTGWVADKVGRPKVILAGHGILLVAALMAATAGGHETRVLFIALFLLGVGWNFSFIAGSAFLSEHAPPAQRVSVEGLADTVVWTSGAAAALTAGILLSVSSFATLCIVGAVATVLPALAWMQYRRDTRVDSFSAPRL